MNLYDSLLATFGYDLLCVKLCGISKSEHVTTVPGDTEVEGYMVDVMSPRRDCPT